MMQPEPFGKFILLGQVAVGGMAEIYKARYADPSMPQEDIALKRILPSYTEDEGFVTMFQDEGNIAIRLKHPNIVNIFEVGEVDNDWYIAMEYIHGTDLRILSDACEKYQKRFTPTQIARIACETSKALDYAHACTAADGTPLNIVHRDCTPHNIMVSETGEIKLMDFGIAKAASRATKTRVGTVKGKSSYMSPEQAKGKALDGRSDMFTLATVSWELLTGYRLFKASTDFDILKKVLKADIIHPSEMDSNIPRELGDIFMKALQRDREMRYPTCGAMAEALENWIKKYGDGSDQQLGTFVLAMTNQKGHTYAEIPDYIPGDSIYECVNGDFKRKGEDLQQSAERSSSNISIDAAASQQSQPYPGAASPYPPPSGQPQVGMQPQYPDPSVMMQPATNRVPVAYIILYIFLILGTGACAYLAYHFHTSDPGEAPKYEALDAFINLKSTPSDAMVSINGQTVLNEDKAALTPVYSHKRKLGDKITVTFEKDGYEPVTIERKVVQLSQDIEVKLTSLEEIAAAQKTSIPKFMITTSPENLKVLINGEEKGNSPVTLEDVEFDTELKIEVIPEDKAYEPAVQTFVVSRDSEDTLNIVLEKVSAVAKNKKEPPKGKTDKKPSQPKDANTTGEGTISITTVPWANVVIDSDQSFSTQNNTAKKVTVSAGSHKIVLKQPQKGKTVSKTVTVKAGQNVSITYNFNTDSW